MDHAAPTARPWLRPLLTAALARIGAVRVDAAALPTLDCRTRRDIGLDGCGAGADADAVARIARLRLSSGPDHA